VTDGQEPVLLTVGRINFDLYAEQLGVTMERATSFRASVGGSPTNIAIVATRLGVPSAVLSAEAGDLTGAAVRYQLNGFGVDTRWLYTVPHAVTSLAVLSTPAPDAGERQFYRSNPADTLLDLAVLEDIPWNSLRAVVLSGDSLSSGTTPQVVHRLAIQAAHRGIDVWWDLDLRPSSWSDAPQRYAAEVLPALSQAQVVIGTEEEFTALLPDVAPEYLVASIRALDLPVVVLKLGPQGALLMRKGENDIHVPSYAVTPVSTVGGGDSAAGALIAGRIHKLSWRDSLELAMRTAAWTVQQPYCSTGFPTAEQIGLPATATPIKGTL
jgi:sugar/nucleoside kinase (ribokinase family)